MRQDGPHTHHILERLRQLVWTEPACSLYHASMATGIHRRNLLRYLRTLVRDNHVAVVESGRSRYLLPPVRGIAAHWRQVQVLKEPRTRDFHRRLASVSPCIQKVAAEIGRDLYGWGLSVTQQRLKQLEGAGLVERFKRTSNARLTHYRALPEQQIVHSLLQQVRDNADFPDGTDAMK